MNSAARNPDIEDLIRARAHKIWEDEGRPEGRSDSHWRQAQDELQRELAEAKPHPEITTELAPERAAVPSADSGLGDIIPDTGPASDPGVAAARPRARAKSSAPKKPRK